MCVLEKKFILGNMAFLYALHLKSKFLNKIRFLLALVE
jgi:hypothetical protein